jgi:hypothetical protein
MAPMPFRMPELSFASILPPACDAKIPNAA